MGISLVRFERSDGFQWGSLEGEKVFPWEGSHNLSLADLLKSKMAKSPTKLPAQDLLSLKLLSPVTSPCQIICQGKNYYSHMRETGVKSKDHNILFTKADSALSPAEGEVVRPEGVRLLDYEVELGLVIGRNIERPVKVDKLEDFVAGLVIGNDISARDIQVPQRQWFKGKSFRTFCPVGPLLYLFDASEVSVLKNLELELRVNGKIRQKGNSSQLMHGPEATLEEISRTFDLRVGDLVLTGTPGGVSMQVKTKSFWQELLDLRKSDKEKFAEFVEEQAASGRYLKDGDIVEARIFSEDGKMNLGMQRLRVVNIDRK